MDFGVLRLELEDLRHLLQLGQVSGLREGEYVDSKVRHEEFFRIHLFLDLRAFQIRIQLVFFGY